MVYKSRNSLGRETTAAKFMLGFFKALGLAPFGVDTSSGPQLLKKANRQDSPLIQVVPSRLGCLYNLFLLALQFRMLVFVWPDKHELEYPDTSKLTATIATAQSVLHNCVFFLILLIFGFKQKTAVKLLNQLTNFDSATFNRNDHHFSDSSRWFFFLVFLIGILVWTVALVSQYVGHESSVLKWFRSIVPFFVITCFEIQYVFVVKLIEKRFGALNRALIENSATSSVEFENRLFFTRNLLINDSYGPKINTIRRAHTNLYEISVAISDLYSLPILIAIAGVSYTALYVTYYMVLPFFAPVRVVSYWIIVNCTSWLIIVMLPITLLAAGVTNMNDTADIVRKLLARSTTRRDDVFELKQFAIDMLHRKIEFTACGFFPLDCTLVYSIFTMVSGYLIMLIQFQIGNYGKNSQNDKHNTTITVSSNIYDRQQ